MGFVPRSGRLLPTRTMIVPGMPSPGSQLNILDILSKNIVAKYLVVKYVDPNFFACRNKIVSLKEKSEDLWI